MKTTYLVTLIALVLGLTVLPAVAGAGTSFERKVSAAPDGVVEVENLNGSITVTGWSNNEVVVSGTLGDWVDELEIHAGDDEVDISVEPYDDWHSDVDEPTILVLKIPKGSELRVDGVNVTIEVSGIDGPLDLETVNGTITVTGSPESVDAETVNGGITINGASTRVDAGTVAGTIRLEGLTGEANAECVSGRIEVRGGSLTTGDFSTVSGDIIFDAGITGRESFDFETHSGSVTLILPADISAEFDVSSFSGDIFNELGPQAHRTDRYTPGKELSFTLGKGHSDISVETFSGDVHIKKK